MVTQTGLFDDLQNMVPTMPEGFRYEEDIISEAEEASLVALLALLELKEALRRWLIFMRQEYRGVARSVFQRSIAASGGFPA